MLVPAQAERSRFAGAVFLWIWYAPRLPMSMLMVIVAADILGIAEWATGDHAEQSRLFYRSAFGIGTVGVAIKALLAGSGL